MNSLYQQLREMDSDQFQRLCAQVLKHQYPGKEIKHIEGAAGDEGIDSFMGTLSGKPHIWQCKAFRNGVGDCQKEQIRKSIRSALKHRPSCWTLCLNVDLDIKTTRWFERFKKSYAKKVTIKQMFALDIYNQLIHDRALKNEFFPNASLDPVVLRRLIARTSEMSMEELQEVTENNLVDMIERWKESDPRLNVQIVTDGDLGPRRSPPLVREGLIMSLSNGTTTVNFFARDDEALRADPPTFSIQFKGTGIEKIISAMDTGAGQKFDADELGNFTTDWRPLSSAIKFTGKQGLVLQPSPMLKSKKRLVRVIFKNGESEVQYGLMEFCPVRIGRKEAEFSITGKNLPFALSLISFVPATTDLRMVVHYNGVGHQFGEIKRSLDALSLLRPDGELRLIDLETDRLFLSMTAEVPFETPRQILYRNIVNDVIQLMDRFNVSLTLPDKVLRRDYQEIARLNRYINSRTEEAETATLVLTKSEENKDLLPRSFATGKGAFRITHPRLDPAPVLFGTAIDTGPVMEEFEAELNDPEEFFQRFRSADIGAGVEMSLRLLTPVRFGLLREDAQAHEIALKTAAS